MGIIPEQTRSAGFAAAVAACVAGGMVSFAPGAHGAITDISDISTSLTNMQGSAVAAAELGLSMDSKVQVVARHYGFDDAAGGLSLWALGAMGGLSDDDEESDNMSGSFGVTMSVSPSVRIGGGGHIGRNEYVLTGDEGNSTDRTALGLQGFVSYEPDGSVARAYVSAFASHLEDDMKRRYLDGATKTSSDGQRNGWSYGGTFRFGLEYPATQSFRIMPFGQYQRVRIDLASFREEGGLAPVNFEEVAHTRQRADFGVELDADLGENYGLWGSLAWAYRVDEETVTVSGKVPLLDTKFSFDGPKPGDDWTALKIGGFGHLSDRLQLHFSFDADLISDGDNRLGGTLGFNLKL